MIRAIDTIDPAETFDLCVVGAGPIGIALALAAADRGLNVALLEAGGREPGSHPELGHAALADPDAHASLRDANCHALGGTSHWWGGRCVPFDPIDFADREWVSHAEWPIAYADVAPYHAAAAHYFGIGSATFSHPGGWTGLDGLRVDQLERWAPNPNMADVHRVALSDRTDIHVILDATVSGLRFSADGGRLSGVTLRSGALERRIDAARTVIACGGTQTPRLLLAAQAQRPHLFGGRDGPLGRYYMGHNFGKIADLVLDDPDKAKSLDFLLDDGVYVRRRFTFPDDVQSCHRLLQTSFSLGNARISDPSHRSGPLSLIWLALASPAGKRMLPEALLKIYVGPGKRRWGAHVGNVIRAALPTIGSAVRIYRDKYIRRPGKPAVFLHSAGGRYTIHYHAEQTPDPDNRLTLQDEVDTLGLPLLKIDFAYSKADATMIVRGHRLLDAALRRNGIGRLEFASDDDDALADDILAQARDGMHQIGAARMSADPAMGVVDGDCRVHGVDNLYLASTCVFPTSSQANPTFLGVTLALRLADHLARAPQVATRHRVASTAA